MYMKPSAPLFWTLLALVIGCSSGDMNEDLDPCCTATTHNVDIRWTIGGGTCAERPFIKKIEIELFDYTTAKKTALTVPCSLNGIDGTTIKAIPDGRYTITINALTEAGSSTAFSSRYHNDNAFDETRSPFMVDLIDGNNPPLNVFFTWLFPSLPDSPAPNCAQLGIEYMDVWFDPPVTPPPPQIILHDYCASGQVGNVYSKHLAPGTWILNIKSVTPVGHPSYSFRGTVTVPPNRLIYSTFQLQKD